MHFGWKVFDWLVDPHVVCCLFVDAMSCVLKQIAAAEGHVSYNGQTGLFTQDLAKDSRHQLWQLMPGAVRKLVLFDSRPDTPKPLSVPSPATLKAAISTIVGRSSGPQAVKGMLSAGPGTATVYAIRKVWKALMARLR